MTLLAERPETAKASAPAKRPKRGLRAKPWWPMTRRILTVGFFLVVVGLLIEQGRHIQWHEVWNSMRHQHPATLLQAAGFTVVCYLAYGTLDLLGRAYTRHEVPRPMCVLAGFISYGFTLTLGSIVGGVAFRFRLYSRLGLENGTIARVAAICMFTNWLGYFFIAGLAFTFVPLKLPPTWPVDGDALRWIGIVLLALACCYPLICALAPKRHWELRGHAIDLPDGRVSIAQIGVASVIWLTTSGVVWTLLHGLVPYPTVLVLMLSGAIAGIIAHVPAGLGVLEALFIAVLSPRIPSADLVGALLGFRAIHYLAPLAIATVCHLVLEARLPADDGA